MSAQKDGVLPISQQSIFVLASLAYHDYEGVALRRRREAAPGAPTWATSNFLMLRNHGLLTVGRSVADAFLAMYFFETTCTIQVRALGGGTAVRRIGQAIVDGAEQQWQAVTQGAGGGLAWPALLRRLERSDAGYRD